mgnify:FL=1
MRMEEFNNQNLSIFFNLIESEKKKNTLKKIKEEENIKEIIKDVSLDELFVLFSEQKKSKTKKTPVANKKEEKNEINENLDKNIQKSLNILNNLKFKNSNIESEEDLDFKKLKLEVEQLRKQIEFTERTAIAQGGGGEVLLEFLDDVDRDTAKVDGKFLKYQSSTGKWVGADVLTLTGGVITGVSTTTTTTSESPIDSFSTSSYRFAKYQIIVTQGSSYHATEINIVHDGSVSYMTEYGTIITGGSLSAFSSDISGGNVRLLATPSSSSSTVFNIIRTLIEI